MTATERMTVAELQGKIDALRDGYEELDLPRSSVEGIAREMQGRTWETLANWDRQNVRYLSAVAREILKDPGLDAGTIASRVLANDGRVA